MPFFGAHVSISGGIHHAPIRAHSLGCSSMQIFCKNQRMWKARPLSEKEILLFQKNVKETKIAITCVHASYLINLGTPDKRALQKSRKSFRLEVKRTITLRIPYLIIHPGAHLGDGEQNCIKRIAESIDWLVERTQCESITILLEIMAGQGTQVGYSFEHLRDIIAYSHYPESIGICYDTCHAFAAGYDIRNPNAFKRTFSKLNKKIGFDKLNVFHLNDSKKDLGSKVDRHEHIGKGRIGIEGFGYLIGEKRFRNHPMIIETPKEKDCDLKNLKVLKRLADERKSFYKS